MVIKSLGIKLRKNVWSINEVVLHDSQSQPIPLFQHNHYYTGFSFSNTELVIPNPLKKLHHMYHL